MRGGVFLVFLESLGMAKHILLPVDLSHMESAETAATVAAEFADSMGAKIHVMTIIPKTNPVVMAYISEDLQAKTKASIKEKMADFVERMLPGKADSTVHVGVDSIYRTILEDAKSMKVDLIVMASHRPDFGDYLLGSNAAKVVRHAQCSVYIVRR